MPDLTKTGAVLVSLIVVLTFGAVLYSVLTKQVPPGAERVLDMLLGALSTMATGVVNYWIGSSRGSSAKDDIIATLGDKK